MDFTPYINDTTFSVDSGKFTQCYFALNGFHNNFDAIVIVPTDTSDTAQSTVFSHKHGITFPRGLMKFTLHFDVVISFLHDNSTTVCNKLINIEMARNREEIRYTDLFTE